MTAAGAMRGFADCRTSSGNRVRYVSRNADGTVNPSAVTGFSGVVLGTAHDSTATYVLYYVVGDQNRQADRRGCRQLPCGRFLERCGSPDR